MADLFRADAFVYYLRRCLHDYGDGDAIDILRQIAGAMAADSKLLIVEQIIGNPPAPFAAAADIFMATIGGKERTAEAFGRIASAAGLKIEKVWPNAGTDVAVIECVKA